MVKTNFDGFPNFPTWPDRVDFSRHAGVLTTTGVFDGVAEHVIEKTENFHGGGNFALVPFGKAAKPENVVGVLWIQIDMVVSGFDTTIPGLKFEMYPINPKTEG